MDTPFWFTFLNIFNVAVASFCSFDIRYIKISAQVAG